MNIIQKIDGLEKRVRELETLLGVTPAKAEKTIHLAANKVVPIGLIKPKSTRKYKKSFSFKQIEYKGRVQPLKAWCDELGLSYKVMRDRLVSGYYTVTNAFELPVSKGRRRPQVNTMDLSRLTTAESAIHEPLGFPFTTSV
jgi:hypothetical protein